MPSVPFPVGGLLYLWLRQAFCFGKLSREAAAGPADRHPGEESANTHGKESASPACCQQAGENMGSAPGEARAGMGPLGWLLGKARPWWGWGGGDVRPQVPEQGFSWLPSSWSFHMGRDTIKPQTDCLGGG